MKRAVFLTGLVAVLVLVIIGLSIYHKPHRTVETEDAVYRMSAAQLVEAFYKDEAEARSKYAGNILEVHGNVREVIRDDDMLIVVLGDPAEMAGVSCSIRKDSHGTANLQPGTSVTVKGVCNGMLIDVVMDNAIVIDEQSVLHER